ncbi:MAG: hypothetical protein ACJ8FS_15850 [Sphingomicrobium sp.]
MSDDAETYKVQIEGAGFTFAREIDGPTLGRVMHAMLGGAGGSALFHSGGSNSNDEGAASERQLSLREFLLEVGAKRYPDKIVAIGHYLEEYESKPGFSKDDIKARFRAAGEPPPGNFPRDFSIAKAQGWIAEDTHNAGQLYVTRTGREAVEQGFSKVSKALRRPNVRRRRSPTLSYQSA